jgi:hypothetical protein
MIIPVLWLGVSLLSFVIKHNKWWYYGWVCRCCHPSVNTICCRIMVVFVVVVVCQKTQYQWSYYVVFLLLMSVSNHNMLSYYGWLVSFVIRQ